MNGKLLLRKKMIMELFYLIIRVNNGLFLTMAT